MIYRNLLNPPQQTWTYPLSSENSSFREINFLSHDFNMKYWNHETSRSFPLLKRLHDKSEKPCCLESLMCQVFFFKLINIASLKYSNKFWYVIGPPLEYITFYIHLGIKVYEYVQSFWQYWNYYSFCCCCCANLRCF